MMVAVVLGMAIAAGPSDIPPDTSPGEGLGLAPNPVLRTATPLSTPNPGSGPANGPVVPLPLAAAAGAAATATGYRRRRDDPLVVVVHGDGGSPSDFSYLVREIGVAPDRIVAFDYSTVDGGVSSTDASRTVSTRAAASELDSLLRELSVDNANIYSVHHSRGGAVGTELIADIDTGLRPPIDGYRGAALLDPAIAAGVTGILQSVGGLGWQLGKHIPDDGGFDPIRCDGFSCRDIRAGLGDKAGVEVVAIRNRDAAVTNFHGQPDDLRVFDLVDDKPHALWYLGNLFAFRSRVSEAHASVLVSPLVAQCLRAELDEPGSCPGLGRSVSPSFSIARANGGGHTKAM